MFKHYQHHQDFDHLDDWQGPGSPIHQGCPSCGNRPQQFDYSGCRLGSWCCPRCGRKGGRYGLL